MDGTERVRGIDAAKVVFEERAKPTLIGNPNGNDMPSVIRAWVDPKTGGLLRAEVRTFESAETRELSSTIRVEFERDPKLELLVPVRMEESFTVPPPDSGLSVAHLQELPALPDVGANCAAAGGTMRILAIATALTALVAAQADNGDAIRDRLDNTCSTTNRS